MSADWKTCRVVRDRAGDLWGRGAADPDPNTFTRWFRLSDGDHYLEYALERFRGPLTPVLDANGLPVVTTVGDLTARHIGRRVRVEGCTFATLGRILATRTLVSLRGLDTDDQSKLLEDLPLDTPCEVLP